MWRAGGCDELPLLRDSRPTAPSWSASRTANPHPRADAAPGKNFWPIGSDDEREAYPALGLLPREGRSRRVRVVARAAPVLAPAANSADSKPRVPLPRQIDLRRSRPHELPKPFLPDSAIRAHVVESRRIGGPDGHNWSYRATGRPVLGWLAGLEPATPRSTIRCSAY